MKLFKLSLNCPIFWGWTEINKKKKKKLSTIWCVTSQSYNIFRFILFLNNVGEHLENKNRRMWHIYLFNNLLTQLLHTRQQMLLDMISFAFTICHHHRNKRNESYENDERKLCCFSIGNNSVSLNSIDWGNNYFFKL